VALVLPVTVSVTVQVPATAHVWLTAHRPASHEVSALL